jgi:hypothetical protein
MPAAEVHALLRQNHIGGLTVDGAPASANARYVSGQAEHAF